MKNVLIILVLLISLSATAQYSDKKAVSFNLLMNEFKMRRIGDSFWIDSIWLPNSIHQILYQRKIIPKPYFGDNEKDLKWIEESDWEIEGPLEYWYDEKIISTELYFHRLEPFVEVYINNIFLFESKNAFMPYKFEIQHLLKKENNRIKFICKSPVKKAKKLEEQKGKLPGDERVYIRKAQFEFGWDWGPRFVTSGITDYITLVSHFEKYVEIKGAYAKTKSINNSKAMVELEIEIFSETNQSKFILINCNKDFNDISINKNIKLKKGLNKIKMEVEIKNPLLWWPNGMGDHEVYDFIIRLSSSKKNKNYGSEYYCRHAFCDIKLIKEKDANGESFYFTVNGKPTYLKGFNIIPSFHIEEFSINQDKLRKILWELDDLNCNAIRVWGGGNYLSNDELNTLLDLGIIVWQDFMFAGGMYPGDSAFMKNVEEEITYQVKRMRNYNNVALYCGNNEIDEAWHNWGWQKQYNYSKDDSTKIWNDYVKLFHELIPSIVKKYNPDTDYIPSSPEIGWGRKESITQGDSHYWGVWWGKEPIETFEEKIPRFMSEFGMQAMPDLSTLRKVIPDSLMQFDSPEFKNHQKHPTGFETLNYYLEKYLKVPDNMEDYAYATQLLQAITLEKAIKAQRMSDKCMGTLIWQLNDTWPVTSWSVIDSEEKKKLAANYIPRLFHPNLIHFNEDSLNYNFTFTREKKYFLQCDPKTNACWYDSTYSHYFTVFLKSFDGKTLKDTSLFCTNKNRIDTAGILVPFSIPKIEWGDFNKSNSYLRIEGIYDAPLIYYFKEYNKIDFKKPELQITCEKKQAAPILSKGLKDYYQVNLKSNQDLQYVKPMFDEEFFTTYFNYDQKLIYCNSCFPTEINANEEIIFFIAAEKFNSEDEVKNYVKSHLKSINHLLGK